MKTIYTKNAPEPVGPYSQGIIAGGFLYLSGCIGLNPIDNNLQEGLINQTNQIMKNINSLLSEAGYNFKDVIKTTCFLDDIKDFSKFNEIYAEYFTSKPARSCVQAKLPKGALVEVEIVAYKE